MLTGQCAYQIGIDEHKKVVFKKPVFLRHSDMRTKMTMFACIRERENKIPEFA